MSISVALCTYNGERYLREQLESILRQSRLPDELIVGDDGSTDATLSIAAEFAAVAGFPVIVLPGEGHLGSTKNFERTIRRCSGDLIALSDQDDRWRPERLARCAAALELHPETGLVFSNAGLIDESGQPLPGSLWNRFGFEGERLRRFRSGDLSILCRERFITGATMMLRRTALAHALPIPTQWLHDAWLGIVLSFQGGLIALDEPLIDYRVHAQQQVGADASRRKQRATVHASEHWERIHREREQLVALEAHLREHPPLLHADLLPVYRARTAFLEFRDALPKGRIARSGPVLRHWREYEAQADGAISALKDWLLPRRSY